MPAVNVNTVSPQLELPVPFAPTQRKLSSEDYFRVFQYTPFNDLPKQLIPLRSHSMRAPLMHCGWTMDRLWKYAEDRGFVRSTATETFTKDELASAELPPISESFVIDEGQCMSNALEDIATKHGIKDILEFTEIERVVRDGKGGFISLYTNYTRKRAPPAEMVEKLRVALGEEEGPKWYLDSFRWHWEPKPVLLFGGQSKSAAAPACKKSGQSRAH